MIDLWSDDKKADDYQYQWNSEVIYNLFEDIRVLKEEIKRLQQQLEAFRQNNRELENQADVLQDFCYEQQQEIEQLQQQEVNWSHPKAQAELSAKARAQLVIKLAEGLIEEGGQEHWSSTDFDYEHPLHDKILNLIRRIAELEPDQETARIIRKNITDHLEHGCIMSAASIKAIEKLLPPSGDKT